MDKRFVFGAALAATMALAAGCDREPEAEGAAPALSPAPRTASVESEVVSLPPPPKDQDVVATVGKAALTWGELSAQVEEMVALYPKATGRPIPTEQLPVAKQQFRRNAVREFIDENLVKQAAEAMGVALDDEFRASQIKEIEAAQGKPFAELMAAAPLGEEKMRALLDVQFLAMKLFTEKLFPAIEVADAEVAELVAKNDAEIALVDAEMAEYAKQIAEHPETFEALVKANSAAANEMPIPVDRLAMLFPEAAARLAVESLPVGGISGVLDVNGAKLIVKVTARSDAAGKAEAKAKIDGIRERILAGEDFAALAKEHSDCPSGQRDGGNLGEFGRGMMVPAFEEAAFSQPIGEVGPVIESPFGYHIVKVTARDEAAGKVTASHILVKTESATVTILPLLKLVPGKVDAAAVREELLETRKREAVADFLAKQYQALGVSCTLYPELAQPLQ